MGALDDTVTQALLTERTRRYRDQLFELLSRRWAMIILTIVPATLLFLTLNMLPILWATAASFFDIGLFNPEWEFVGLQNYGSLLTGDQLWTALWQGFVFTFGATAIQLTMGVGLAFLINRSFRFRSMVRTVVLLPYLIPTAFVGILGIWMLNSSFGIVNSLLARAGLIGEYVAWFGNPDTAMAAVIATYSWKMTFFVTILVLAQLQSIPRILYEAAEVNGATTFDKFRDITLPNLKGVLFIVILLRGVWTFNKFDIIWVLTGGGPAGATTTLPVFGYESAFVTGNLGVATAISVVMYLIILVSASVYFVVLEPEQEVRVE